MICPGDCNTCENAEVCTSCRNRALLYKNQCLKECPATHYPEISGDIGGECLECKGLCSECQMDDNCTQCKPEGFLHGTSRKWLRRESLQHEGRRWQNKVLRISSPMPGHLYPEGLKKTCAKQCPVGFYKVKGKKTNKYWSRERGINGLFGGTCEPCGSDCHDCVDLETCLKCQKSGLAAGHTEQYQTAILRILLHGAPNLQGKFLNTKSQCVSGCPDGFWGKGSQAVGRTCEACAENCTTCLSDETHPVTRRDFFGLPC